MRRTRVEPLVVVVVVVVVMMVTGLRPWVEPLIMMLMMVVIVVVVVVVIGIGVRIEAMVLGGHASVPSVYVKWGMYSCQCFSFAHRLCPFCSS